MDKKLGETLEDLQDAISLLRRDIDKFRIDFNRILTKLDTGK